MALCCCVSVCVQDVAESVGNLVAGAVTGNLQNVAEVMADNLQNVAGNLQTNIQSAYSLIRQKTLQVQVSSFSGQ